MLRQKRSPLTYLAPLEDIEAEDEDENEDEE